MGLIIVIVVIRKVNLGIPQGLDWYLLDWIYNCIIYRIRCALNDSFISYLKNERNAFRLVIVTVVSKKVNLDAPRGVCWMHCFL